MRLTKGQFRRYNFCLRLSHAISKVRAARVIQKIAHNSRNSTPGEGGGGVLPYETDGDGRPLA